MERWCRQPCMPHVAGGLPRLPLGAAPGLADDTHMHALHPLVIVHLQTVAGEPSTKSS